MAKCKLDIKYDIIDAVRSEALSLGGFRNYSKDTLEIADAPVASLTSKTINDKYGEMILTGSMTSRNHYFIEPSESIVDKYYQSYRSKIVADAAALQEEERRRGDYTEEDRGEFFQAMPQSTQEPDEVLSLIHI